MIIWPDLSIPQEISRNTENEPPSIPSNSPNFPIHTHFWRLLGQFSGIKPSQVSNLTGALSIRGTPDWSTVQIIQITTILVLKPMFWGSHILEKSTILRNPQYRSISHLQINISPQNPSVFGHLPPKPSRPLRSGLNWSRIRVEYGNFTWSGHQHQLERGKTLLCTSVD